MSTIQLTIAPAHNWHLQMTAFNSVLFFIVRAMYHLLSFAYILRANSMIEEDHPIGVRYVQNRKGPNNNPWEPFEIVIIFLKIFHLFIQIAHISINMNQFIPSLSESWLSIIPWSIISKAADRLNMITMKTHWLFIPKIT